MTRVLNIHIGAHKTATTALQSTFLRNSEILAQNGILYPDSNRLHFAHHRLSFALRGLKDHKHDDVPDFNIEIAELRKAIEDSPQPQIFISSEEFFVCSAKQLHRLHKALDLPINIRIIATIRRQDDYLLSVYNQRSKTIGNGFIRPLRWHVQNPRDINREISFFSHLKRWRKEFGANSVKLLRYEDGEPLAAMLEILGLPEKLITAPNKRVNQSTPSAVAEAVRVAKCLRLPRSGQIMVRELATRIFSGGKRRALSDTERRKILVEFASENDAMFSTFGMENTYLPSD
ncbi:MAG: Sulfotransferase domain [Rhodobacteraceae bacterium HLUCCO07]|nr:MAG: Sulfotransferase domain [Rhodobacteraceae bacterium HLUCCO07]